MNSKILFIFIIIELLLMIFFAHRIINNDSSLLKKSVALSYPQINNRDISDWEKVNLLRQWVAENTPWGTSSTQIKQLFWNKEAPEIYNVLKHNANKGGVDCSGFSYFLMKLYKLYGYESYSYHYGNLDSWNDVVTLVKINHQGKKILVIEQALFDATIVDKKQRPYDFFNLLSAIKAGKIDEIKIIQGKAKPHASFCRPKKDQCFIPSGEKIVKLPDGKIRYQEKFTLDQLKNNLDAFLFPRFLQSNNDQENTDEMMKKIKKIVGN